MAIDIEYPEELSIQVGRISLHFQRLEYEVFNFAAWLLGDTDIVKKRICKYTFNSLVKSVDKSISNNSKIPKDISSEYEEVYNNIKLLQSGRNKIVHSIVIITNKNRSFEVRYNTKEIIMNGLKSIENFTISDYVNLLELLKNTIRDFNNFSCKYKALNQFIN